MRERARQISASDPALVLQDHLQRLYSTTRIAVPEIGTYAEFLRGIGNVIVADYLVAVNSGAISPESLRPELAAQVRYLLGRR